VHTWYQYRDAWAERPALLGLAVLAIAMIVASVYGTVVRDVLALFFIPGLGALYLHHILVQRMSN
jgi:uncharacterized membrane protein (UPF0182 family)